MPKLPLVRYVDGVLLGTNIVKYHNCTVLNYQGERGVVVTFYLYNSKELKNICWRWKLYLLLSETVLC